MQTRSTPSVVNFFRPFHLVSLGRELPAGSYAIETDEEVLEGVASLMYRRTEVRIFLPVIAGVSEAEMWTVSPRELDAALATDSVSTPSIPLISAASTLPDPDNTTGQGQASARHDQKASIPLYGSLVGVVALLLATLFLRQS